MKLLITTQAVDKNHPILAFFVGWITEFAKHFDEVHVICLQKGEYNFPEHVHVYSLGKEDGESKLKYTWRFYKYFWQLYMKGHVDFVFFHMGAIYNIMAAPFFFIRKLRKTKFYWWKTHGRINFMGKIASFFVDKIYTASTDNFPLIRKVQAVGHGIDTSHTQLPQAELHRPIQLICVGRVTQSKNFEMAILLGKLLLDALIDFKMRIIGEVHNTQYKETLENLVVSLGLSEKVEFTGPKKQMELFELYKESDILIHPSKTGSMDKAVLEAMMFGVLPIAGQKAYGSVLDDFNLSVKKNEPKAFLAVFSRITKLTSEELRILKANLLNRVKQQHSLDTLSHRIFNT